ncbi:hypothetical protein [Planctomicrobium piriforme]|uniref:DUF4197 domain-containing protein n=1 Tax=Planctomicrobium piriforme TaxID=1576369 RepID=A0A1I3BMP7_9PLAN|nr:hypothetical protein [Planctomicrobium piriforme]SFH63179.1 hypothetical protein SAMN05421753_101524 [Planctomicrobium piriforme]
MTLQQIALVFVVALLFNGSSAYAAPATPLFKAIVKFFSKEVTQTGAEKLSKEVGEELVERVSARVVNEGGEVALERLSVLTTKYGPDVIRAMDNSPDIVPILKALDDLPADQISIGISRLAAGKQGQELAEATVKFGASAIRAEILQPGVGVRFVRGWGDDGVALCSALSNEQAVAVARHIDNLASLPPPQRKGLLAIIQNDKDRFFAWLGVFVKANPGYTIGSATFLAAFLPNSDRILGGDEISFDKDGNPFVIRKSGLLERPLIGLTEAASDGARWISYSIAAVFLIFGTVAAVKLWRLRFAFRHRNSSGPPETLI